MKTSNEHLKEELQQLRQAYAANLPEKVRTVADQWASMRSQHDKEAMSELILRVHSLAGSGTTFGFPSVTDTARRLEEGLKALQQPQAGSKAIPVSVIDTLVEGLIASSGKQPEPVSSRFGQQHRTSPAMTRKDNGNRPVLIVEDTEISARELTLQLRHYGFQVQTVSSLQELPELLDHIVPSVILMDIIFPEGDKAGIECVSALRKQHVEMPPIIFLSERQDIQTRLEATRAGGVAYFNKPVDLVALTDRLDEIISPEIVQPYRIMVVEDDADVAYHTALVLRGAGMETRVVTDPSDTLELLDDFRPDLILMDLYMPDCTGIELAAVIRQQETYLGTPIVFLSGETDIRKHLDAMRAGGDDFLLKPIVPVYLVASIEARVERARRVNSFMAKDGLTGLLNHSNTEEQLNRELARARRDETPLTYAILDLDKFKSVNDTYGHIAGDRVLRSLARLLRNRLRESDLIGRYGGEEFAVVFPNTGLESARQVLEEIRDIFSNIPHDNAENSTFTVTFSAGMASCPPHQDVVKLVHTADEALYRAKREGRNRIVLATEKTAMYVVE